MIPVKIMAVKNSEKKKQPWIFTVLQTPAFVDFSPLVSQSIMRQRGRRKGTEKEKGKGRERDHSVPLNCY